MFESSLYTNGLIWTLNFCLYIALYLTQSVGLVQASAVQASLQQPQNQPYKLYFQPYRLHNRGFN